MVYPSLPWMLAVLGNQQREMQAAVSQAKKGEKEKTNPEKEGWVLPCYALSWKSFYSHLLLGFPLSFSCPSSGSGCRGALSSHVPPLLWVVGAVVWEFYTAVCVGSDCNAVCDPWKGGWHPWLPEGCGSESGCCQSYRFTYGWAASHSMQAFLRQLVADVVYSVLSLHSFFPVWCFEEGSGG